MNWLQRLLRPRETYNEYDGLSDAQDGERRDDPRELPMPTTERKPRKTPAP